jgi:hypothetical protein
VRPSIRKVFAPSPGIGPRAAAVTDDTRIGGAQCCFSGKTPINSPFPPPPHTFTGLVTDSRGNPVNGAEVWVYGNSSPIDDRRGAGFTDASGRYTIVAGRLASEARAPRIRVDP